MLFSTEQRQFQGDALYLIFELKFLIFNLRFLHFEEKKIHCWKSYRLNRKKASRKYDAKLHSSKL